MGQWIIQQSYNIGLKAPHAWQHDLWFLIMGALIFVCVILPLILVVAYLTLWERKVLAWAHFRLGPNRAGPFGILQPLCDAVKLLIKEDIVPLKIDWFVWVLAPIVAFAPMVACFLAIPMSYGEIVINWPGLDIPQFIQIPMIAADVGIGILLILSLSTLVVIGIITAGFGSNNKYSMFGGVRSAGQIISYEVPIILCILSVVLVAGSMSTVQIVEAQRYFPAWKINNFLEVDNITTRSPEGTFTTYDMPEGPRLSDWAATAAYLEQVPVEERDTDGVEAFYQWNDFRQEFHKEREGKPLESLFEDSLAGQKLKSEYNVYNITKGSPRLPFIIPMLLAFLVYFIAGVAETNRSPFDLPEGESEIVAGFHTEYTGIKFGLFFLGEYGNMILISAIATTAFLGGYLGPAWSFMKPVADTVGHFFYYFMWFALKVGILVSIMIWFRATFPRLRVDQLTDFAWKVLVPLSIINLLVVGYLQFGDWNLRAIGEANWVLWYGNLIKPFNYPAIRLVMLLVLLPILSDILYPYRRIWQFDFKLGKMQFKMSTFVLFEIAFSIGFMGFRVFRQFFFKLQNPILIELVIQWIFYGLSLILIASMIWDYIKAKRAGVQFVSATDEEIVLRKNDPIEHQAVIE